MTRRPDDIDGDIREELRDHLEQRMAEHLARGVTREEAEAEATRRFGSIAAIERQSHEARRGRATLAHRCWQDLRHAAVALTRHPGPALTGAAVAAIGLAASLTVARVAIAIAGPPPGLTRPGELVSVLETTNGQRGSMLSYAVFREMERAAADTPMGAWSAMDVQLSGGGATRSWPAAVVTGSYFATLGVAAASGRLITPGDVDAHANLIVVSHRVAATLAAVPSDAVGRDVTIRGVPFVVAGVLPRQVLGLNAARPIDVFVPMSSEPDLATPTVFPDGHVERGFSLAPGIGFLQAVARLPEGPERRATADRWSSVVKGARARVSDRPVTNAGVWLTDRPWLTPFADSRASILTTARLLTWAAALTWLLAATCLGSLMLGRVAGRVVEFGIRMTQGATRSRLARLVLFEAGFVVAIGAAIAWPASAWLLARVSALHLPTGITVGDAAAFAGAWRSIGLLLVLAAALTAVAAMAPAALIRRPQVTASSRVTMGHTRLWRALLASEIAFGCALLYATWLLTASIGALQSRPLGFDAAGTVFAATDPAGAGLDLAAQTVALAKLDSIAARDRGLAYGDTVPFGDRSTLFLKGQDSSTRTYPFGVTRISEGYLDVMGIPLVDGRAFSAGDRTRHVAVISEPLAEVYWPGQRAVGRTILVGGERGVPYEVVGVVRGIRDESLKSAPAAQIYLPLSEEAERLIVIASAAEHDTGRRLGEVERLIASVDPRLATLQHGTLRSLAWRATERHRLLRQVTAIVGLSGLGLIALGVWGLSHASLRRRWREFGVRLALGGSRREVLRRALAEAAVVGASGAVLGILGAWQVGRVLASWLFDVQPVEPWAVGASAALTVAAAFAGAWWPARRAARVDPAMLLRQT